MNAQFQHVYSEKQRKRKIDAEKKRLRELLNLREGGTGLKADSRLCVASGLIDQAAFLFVLLEELDLTIQRDGYVENYQNGEAQWGSKKSVAADMLDRYTKTYAAVTKQLCELVEDTDPEDMEELKKHFGGRPGGVGG